MSECQVDYRSKKTRAISLIVLAMHFFNCLAFGQFYYLYEEHTYPKTLKIDLYHDLFEERNWLPDLGQEPIKTLDCS